MSAVSLEKRHVLVISDEPRVLAEIKMGLMSYFDVSMAAASGAAMTMLEMYKVSAVVIYIGENRNKAFSVFDDIFEFIIKECIPVVFLAENDSENDEVAAFAAGAADYAVRRSGGGALVDRINLRVRASESEKRILGYKGDSSPRAVSPEAALAGKTILIADDIELNRVIIANMLSDVKGLTLNFAGDGKEAVEKFARDPELYSLILMDVQMPEMNGLDATKTIRGLDCENAREIPIIALTASTREDERALCLEAGMNDFIEKPMVYDNLLKLTTEYCL